MVSRKRYLIILLLIAALFVIPVTATVYFFISGQIQTAALTESPVIFTSGDDTSAIGGSIQYNKTYFSCNALPIYVSIGVYVTEAVNISNTDGSNYGMDLQLSTEDFDNKVTNVTVWLVRPDNTKYVSIYIDDNGDVITSSSGSKTIQSGQEWAVMIYIEMDNDVVGTSSYTFSFILGCAKLTI